MSETFEGRPRRIKGSGDHRWTEWSETPIGRPRTCLDCGREDDGYQQPCERRPSYQGEYVSAAPGMHKVRLDLDGDGRLTVADARQIAAELIAAVQVATGPK